MILLRRYRTCQKKFLRDQKYQTLGGRDTLKTTSNRKKNFKFFIVAKIRSDETPNIFNFKKGEIMKHFTASIMKIGYFKLL